MQLKLRATSFFLAALLLEGCNRPSDLVTDLPVLKVNETTISAKQFGTRLARRLRRYDTLTVKEPSVLQRAKEDVIQAYILEILALQHAQVLAVRATSEELKAEVEKRKKAFPDDFAFRKSLAEENISIDAWSKEIEESLVQQKVFAHIVRDVGTPSEEEIKKYYDSHSFEFVSPPRVKLRQIVLEKEEDAKRVMEQLGKGSKMATLAQKFSVAPEGADGGETDWIEKGVLDVFDQAFKMPVGTRSKIMRSPYGWHIYDVIRKTAEQKLSFKDARERIKTELVRQRQKAAHGNWLEEQLRKSKVFRNESLIESIAVTTRSDP